LTPQYNNFKASDTIFILKHNRNCNIKNVY